MLTVGLLVRLKAKAGKQAQLEQLLKDAQPMAVAEAQTPVWFGFKDSAGTCYIFDAFAGEAGRTAHLSGPIAAALGKVAPELLDGAPDIQQVSVLASKVTT
jgi:quinol monooxygenase YgiN